MKTITSKQLGYFIQEIISQTDKERRENLNKRKEGLMTDDEKRHMEMFLWGIQRTCLKLDDLRRYGVTTLRDEEEFSIK